MRKLLKQLYWFLTGRSTCCGARLDIWDERKAFCKTCGKRE